MCFRKMFTDASMLVLKDLKTLNDNVVGVKVRFLLLNLFLLLHTKSLQVIQANMTHFMGKIKKNIVLNITELLIISINK